MSKEKQITRKANAVLTALRSFDNVLMAKGGDFNIKKIKPLYHALEREISSQSHALIKASQVPDKPRRPKQILADIAANERLTPELLDEIKRSQG